MSETKQRCSACKEELSLADRLLYVVFSEDDRVPKVAYCKECREELKHEKED
jgi:hypothetical protein